MFSLKSLVKGTKAAGLGLIVLLVVRALGWSQEAARPPIDEEIAKQDKIYHSRGAEVPEGYVTNRRLSDYAALLPTGFCDALGSLRSSDQWLDVGAGDGQAILDYYAPADEAAPVEKCAKLAGRARAVALSIEDRRTDKWQQHAASLGDDRLRYLFGKRLREYSNEELGKFQLITDVYGGFSYTEDLSQFVEKVLSLVETGGVFYTLLQSVLLEDGKDKPNIYYQTELVDTAGQDVNVCSWLKKTSCVQVGCESKTDWTPTEVINVRKVCSAVSVPRVKLLKFEAGNPPARRFQVEP